MALANYSHYYDREGQPCSMMEAGRRREFPETMIVSRDTFEDGDFLSTVWLAIEHGTRDGKPVIFESMSKISGEWVGCNRYTTQQEAAYGHEVWLKELIAQRIEQKKTIHVVERWRPIPGKFESAATNIEAIEFRFEFVKNEETKSPLPEATVAAEV